MFLFFCFKNLFLKKGIAFFISEKMEPFFSIFPEQPLPHPTDIFRITFLAKLFLLDESAFLTCLILVNIKIYLFTYISITVLKLKQTSNAFHSKMVKVELLFLFYRTRFHFQKKIFSIHRTDSVCCMLGSSLQER